MLEENKENIQELYKNFNEIMNLLNINEKLTNDEILLVCNNFVNNLKEDNDVLNYFKNCDYVCFEKVNFFENKINNDLLINYLKDDDKKNLWINLQFIVVLYEIYFNNNNN